MPQKDSLATTEIILTLQVEAACFLDKSTASHLSFKKTFCGHWILCLLKIFMEIVSSTQETIWKWWMPLSLNLISMKWVNCPSKEITEDCVSAIFIDIYIIIIWVLNKYGTIHPFSLHQIKYGTFFYELPSNKN